MLYQLDTAYKIFRKSIIKDYIKKLRYPIYYLAFSFLKKKILIKKKNISFFLLNDFKSFGVAKFFLIKDPEILKWIESFEKNSKFLDIGANIGIYSLYAAKHEVKTMAIEPNFINFSQLNKNIFINNIKNISSALFFLEQENRLLTIKVSNFSIGNSENYSFNNSSKGLKYVKNILPATTLDQFCSEIDFWPNYIKFDIDGNELNVIKGCKKTLLNKNFRSIHIEFMDTRSFDAVLDLFNEIGLKHKIVDIFSSNSKSFNVIINKIYD